LPTALITGAAGQDGLHLARYLQSIGYHVAGTILFGSVAERQRIQRVAGDIQIITADLTDLPSLINAVRQAEPQEIYNLGGISSVRLCWDQPSRAAEVNGFGLVNVLEAVRAVHADPAAVKVFQASSAQIFGDVGGDWFTEETPVRPISPYGASKAFAHFTADAYRRQYGMFVSCGILGNHESSLHDEEFVVRRITSSVRRIADGDTEPLRLDNLTATRDWGYAGDFVVAMHAALQQETPEDFVIATGELRSVADVVRTAFAVAGIDDWEPRVELTNASAGRAHRGVKGDISKARRLLGWSPRTSFEDLITSMVKEEASAGVDAAGTWSATR
jgi:GDPmannose 4,6-dehydratase